MVFQHVKEFIAMVNTKYEGMDLGIISLFMNSMTYDSSGLGYYSEQSFESLHSDMKVILCYK